MGRVLNSLLFRLAASAVLINVTLGPLLYMQLERISRTSHIETFTSDVRSYTRLLADTLEVEIDRWSQIDLVDFLDRVILSRDAVFAHLAGPDLSFGSLYGDSALAAYTEDFSFGDHDDDTYFLSVPIDSERYGRLSLQIGFSELPTVASLEAVQGRIVVVLVTFMGLSLLLAMLMGLLITRPLRRLQAASQAISAGDLDKPFDVNTRMLEIRELAGDLNSMRTHLVRANKRLHKEIAERRDLERVRARLESTLRHSQRLETIGTLAGGIAHEFNNLLLPMKFYTEMAIEDLPAASAIRTDLRHVVQSIDRAKRIVQQVLAFGRRSPDETFVAIDLGDIVRDVIGLSADIFPPSIEWTSEIEPDLPEILGDETQIHQVFMNLCSNAVQAMERKGGLVSVTVSRYETGPDNVPEDVQLRTGEYIRTDVADQGRGMDALTVARIFEPFFTSRMPGEGTGLGLSVVHGIVLGHGGHIVASSEVGEGSVFSVFLPIPKQGVQAGAVTSVTFIGTGDALAPYIDMVDSAKLSARTIDTAAELADVLVDKSLRDQKIVLIIADEEFWHAVIESGFLVDWLIERGAMVVVASAMMLTDERVDWARMQYVVGPVNATQLNALVQQLRATVIQDRIGADP